MSHGHNESLSLLQCVYTMCVAIFWHHIVLNLGESNTFPQKRWFWRGTHQLNNNLPLQFLSPELPLYLTPIVCCHRKTNPRHSSLWFAIEGFSYSESARRAFVPPNYRDDDFNTYACLPSSSVIVREIWWRHQAHVSEEERSRVFTQTVDGLMSPKESRRGGPRWTPLRLPLSPCICLSLRTCHGKWW